MEEIIKEYLKCLLTEAEMKKEAEKMAYCFSQLSELEATLKSAKKRIESDIARVEAELSLSVEKYRSGFEMKNIDCRVDKDFQTNTVRVIRLDTFETIRERAMTADERQMEMDLQNKEETPEEEVETQSKPMEGAKATTVFPDREDLPDADVNGYMKERKEKTD